jgi:two-component system NtrC family sensor kinase
MVERRAWVENIKIIENIDEHLPRFRSDPAQLQQVLLNLLNNAIDAIDSASGGEIRITVAGNGNEILISLADNGSGIEPEHLEKIFVPFFTTKPVGRGTGLGLSTCYGIVDSLGGSIEVCSELGAGTVFTVHLPTTGPSASFQHAAVAMNKKGGAL